MALEADMDLCVELAGVRKSYGRNQVLRGVDLTVARGEVVGLLGPNGSGKTTTLRIISGFLAPDAGEVRVCGQSIGPDSRAVRAKVGYLPERPPLYDPLTVQEYLGFVAAAKGLSGPARQAAIKHALAAFDLGEVRRKVIGRLSKGFRQRVGLAQATLGEPEVLLLDEATSGLDPVQIIEARNMIREAGAGRAVVFSSHVMQEVAALCSRVLVIHNGRVVEVERPQDGSAAAPSSVDVELGGVEPEAALALVGAVPGVARVALKASSDATGVRLRVVCAPGSDPRDGIAAAVLSRASLRALTPYRPSLEESFVASISAAHEEAVRSRAAE